MELLSNASTYGLRALIYLASEKRVGEYISIGEISHKLNISFYFLTKIFQTLSHHGILESSRGPKGGVILKKPADQVYLIDIIRIFEGDDAFSKCMLGLPGCGTETPCPVHHFWKEIRDSLNYNLSATSLADLGDEVNKETVRLLP